MISPGALISRESSLYMNKERNHELLSRTEEILYSRQYKIKTGIEERKRQLEISRQRKISDLELAADLGIGVEKLRVLVEKGENGRAKLMNSNLRLIFHIARFYQFRGMKLSDLYHEGAHGLAKAIDRYDPEKGFRFSTYASWWIRQAISRAIAEKSRFVRIPTYTHDALNAISQAEKRIENKKGDVATLEEVAAAVNLTSAKVLELKRTEKKITSLDTPAVVLSGDKDPDDRAKQDVTSSGTATPVSTLSTKNVPFTMQDMLYKLSRRESNILKMRYGLTGGKPLTLGEVGLKFNITKERARQIEALALAKLKEPAFFIQKMYNEEMNER